MRRVYLSFLALAAIFAVQSPAAMGAASLGEPFALPEGTKVEALAVGAEGDLWFGGSVTGSHAGNVLGRILPTGKVEEHPVPESGTTPGIGAMAAGPEGNMLFTEPAADCIGWMTTTGQTAGLQAPSSGARPTGMVVTPGGTVWVTMEGTGAIAKVDLGSGAAVEFPLGAGARPTELTLASDSALWAIDRDTPQIVRQPLEGRAETFPLPIEGGNFTAGTTDTDIVAGSDGNLWLSQSDGPYVARVKAIGGQTEYVRYRLPIRGGTSLISNGPAKDIWFASGSLIGSVPTHGLVAGETLCAVEGCPTVTALAEGPAGKLWFGAGRFVGAFRSPDLRLSLPKRLGRPRGKKVPVTIECRGGAAGEACTGTLQLRLAGKPGSAISNRVGFHAISTRQAVAKVSLSRLGAASLATEGRLRVRLVARLGTRVAGLREYTLRAGR